MTVGHRESCYFYRTVHVAQSDVTCHAAVFTGLTLLNGFFSFLVNFFSLLFWVVR